MNDAEKDRHIERLEQEVGALKVQVTALMRVLMEPPETNPKGDTLLKRMMTVTETMERGQWAVTWTFRIGTAVATFMGAVAAIYAFGRGMR